MRNAFMTCRSSGCRVRGGWSISSAVGGGVMNPVPLYIFRQFPSPRRVGGDQDVLYASMP